MPDPIVRCHVCARKLGPVEQMVASCTNCGKPFCMHHRYPLAPKVSDRAGHVCARLAEVLEAQKLAADTTPVNASKLDKL